MPIITDKEKEGKVSSMRLPEGFLIVLIVILASTGSFGLGYLSGKESAGADVIIQQPVSREETQGEVAGVSSEMSTQVSVKRSAQQTPSREVVPSAGQYVASKKGTKYHLPWCPGAKAMNEENKIYFNSKEEAEAAGYTPAVNCKGI